MIINPYIDILKEAAQFLDARLSKLDHNAEGSDDPDQSGEYDSAEYITGLGFIACQQYMACAFAGKGINKRIALDLGPKHRCGVTFAALVNAAANYWKHCTEWEGPNVDRVRVEQTSQPLQRLGVNIEQSYALVNILHEILRPHPPRFLHLVPFLERWHDAVLSNHAGRL